MKKTAVIITLLIIFLLSGCSVQERVSPLILIDRLSKQSSEIFFDPQQTFFEDNTFICFIEYKNISNITVKMHTSEDSSVKKISVYSTFDNHILELIKLLIKIYSPKENSEKICEELIKNADSFKYYNGKEYTYSLFISDESIYFEVFNKNLSEYTIPELTLKPNDRIKY